MGEQRNVSSNSDQEIDNRTNSHKNVSLITNQEIHELLEEEVKKIKENKTKSVAGKRKVPPEDTKNNKGREINSNEKENLKTYCMQSSFCRNNVPLWSPLDQPNHHLGQYRNHNLYHNVDPMKT